MSSWTLYWIFVKIGLFTFGGGYAMIPLFQDELVTKRAFISMEDFANMLALSQMTPGPVGLNVATYVGYQQNGFWGSVAGTLGVITPSFVLVTLVACFFLEFRKNRWIQAALSGIRPATVGLIAAAVIFFAEASIFTGPLKSLWSKIPAQAFGVSWQGLVIFAAVIVVEWKWKPGMVKLLAGSALLGYLLCLF